MNSKTVRPPYYQICREERNFAAILYAALCRDDKLRTFLKLCGIDEPVSSNDLEVYFEYAYLRDIWNSFETKSASATNISRKSFIHACLGIKVIEKILFPDNGTDEILGINQRLCGGPLSSKLIQSPGRWDLEKLWQITKGGDDYEKLCRFKWVFNIKPDLVIHFGVNRAICVEAKHESGEGRYSEKNGYHCGQLDLQRYLMSDVLGFQDPKFVYIVSNPGGGGSQGLRVLTWKEVFDTLNIFDKGSEVEYLPFAVHLVDNIVSKSKKVKNENDTH